MDEAVEACLVTVDQRLLGENDLGQLLCELTPLSLVMVAPLHGLAVGHLGLAVRYFMLKIKLAQVRSRYRLVVLVQEENNVEYLVATTSIITGESFIDSLATKLEAPTF